MYALRAHRREAELAHMAQLGKMSAVLAHEIRNPLGTIKGFAQLIGERAGAERDFVDAILAETSRLERLVQDLLLYGRPPAPRPRECAWNEIRGSLLARLRPDPQVRVQCDPSEVCWETDPDLLLQSLVNLSQNAIEAIPAGRNGEVNIQLTAGEPPGVTITITDNGTGLGEEARPRLFEPFFTTKATGTGLGLVITRRLAASLGGSLELAPAGECGTRATLHFPQAQVRAGETVCNAS